MPVSSDSATGDGACEILASGCGMSSILPGEGGGEVTAGRGRVCQRGRPNGGTPRPKPSPILTLIQFGDSGPEKSL